MEVEDGEAWIDRLENLLKGFSFYDEGLGEEEGKNERFAHIILVHELLKDGEKGMTIEEE